MKVLYLLLLLNIPLFIYATAEYSFAITAYELEREYHSNRSDLSYGDKVRAMDEAYTSRQPYNYPMLLSVKLMWTALFASVVAGFIFFIRWKKRNAIMLLKRRYPDRPDLRRYHDRHDKLFLGNNGALVKKNDEIIIYKSDFTTKNHFLFNYIERVICKKNDLSKNERSAIRFQILIKGEFYAEWEKKDGKIINPRNCVFFNAEMIDHLNDLEKYINAKITHN